MWIRSFRNFYNVTYLCKLPLVYSNSTTTGLQWWEAARQLEQLHSFEPWEGLAQLWAGDGGVGLAGWTEPGSLQASTQLLPAGRTLVQTTPSLIYSVQWEGVARPIPWAFVSHALGWLLTDPFFPLSSRLERRPGLNASVKSAHKPTFAAIRPVCKTWVHSPTPPLASNFG
jgi:hypothetical protein